MRNQTENRESIPVLFLLKILLFSYLLTGILLAFLAFLLYKLGLTEKVVAIVIIAIYVGATFCAGFLTGKERKNKKFLWGLLMGSIYFLILLGISFLAGDTGPVVGTPVITTFILCAAGGMLGGMLS